ncbi:MAG: flagellar biosynthesis protein FliQ [Fibrobacterota bacterium]
MNPAVVVDIGRDSLILMLMISGPILVAGLVVGLAVGIFQAVTQINEMTLTFIPKILAIFGVMVALLPWMMIKMVDYVVRLFEQIPYLIG